jgi:hypothetical protein
MIVIILMSVACGAFPVFIKQIIDVRTGLLKDDKYALWAVLGLTAALLIAMGLGSLLHRGFLMPDWVVDNLHILFKTGWVLKGIVVVTLLLCVPEAVLVFMIGRATDVLAGKLDKPIPEKPDLKWFEERASEFDLLNRGLNNAVITLAVIVALTVLSLVALSTSINNTVLASRDFPLVPDSLSIVYGLLLSLFLGILYVPVYLVLAVQNKHLRSLFDTHLPTNSDNAEWSKRVSDLIDMKNPSKDNFKLVLTILSPLITSLLPQLGHLNF